MNVKYHIVIIVALLFNADKVIALNNEYGFKKIEPQAPVAVKDVRFVDRILIDIKPHVMLYAHKCCQIDIHVSEDGSQFIDYQAYMQQGLLFINDKQKRIKHISYGWRNDTKWVVYGEYTLPLRTFSLPVEN